MIIFSSLRALRSAREAPETWKVKIRLIEALSMLKTPVATPCSVATRAKRMLNPQPAMVLAIRWSKPTLSAARTSTIVLPRKRLGIADSRRDLRSEFVLRGKKPTAVRFSSLSEMSLSGELSPRRNARMDSSHRLRGLGVVDYSAVPVFHVKRRL